MMSCGFERLQFLEYYQEKKVIFLEFSPPSRCPEKAVSQSSPSNAVTGKCFSGLHISCTLFSHWKNLGPQRFLPASHLNRNEIRVLGYSSGFLRVWGGAVWFLGFFICFCDKIFSSNKIVEGKDSFSTQWTGLATWRVSFGTL